jgi:hypothetical protein
MRIHTKLILATALVCGPKTVLAHDAAALRACETRLMLEQAANSKLGYLPEFKTEQMKPFTKAEGTERFMISAISPRFGMVLAFFDYTLTDQGHTLEIEKVEVLNHNNYRKGLSNLLFAHAMEKQTQVSTVIATLADVNRRELEAAGGNCVEAFAQTPLGKMLAHYGFSQIAPLQCNPATQEYRFAVTREMVH